MYIMLAIVFRISGRRPAPFPPPAIPVAVVMMLVDVSVVATYWKSI